MDWKTQLNGDPFPWLLEKNDTAARHVTMRDLLGLPEDNPELKQARAEAHHSGFIPAILDHMNPEGWWDKPGGGYGPKYFSGVWSLISLGQLGASANEDHRIQTACKYYLDHAISLTGSITYNGAPGGNIACLEGNMLTAIMSLGFEDARIERAYDWMARTVTGEGIAKKEDKKAEFRYYAYKCGPDFACGANYGAPCGWGAVKVMLAFSKLPVKRRTPIIKKAIERGVEFLLEKDPIKAEFPVGDGKLPSRNWWKLGFPIFYITDLLQLCEGLVALGYGKDPRMKNVLELVRGKQNYAGQWLLEYDYKGKSYLDTGRKGQPSKWVTLRALRVLKGAGQ